MSLFNTIKKRYAQVTAKQFILSGVFMLAFAGAIGAGFASKEHSNAAVFYGRDPNVGNSIMNVGNVGCLSKEECYNDIKNNNPGDLQGIYNNFGLQYSEYDRFLGEAREGIVYKNGTVVVDGQTVMTNTWSIGRHSKSYSWPHVISGVGTYHASMSTQVQGSDLPVYVMFDADGNVEFVLMKACGNSVWGDRVLSGGECKQLVKTPVEGKKNTYKFTSEASVFGYAQIVKYEYFYNEGNGDVKFGETTNGATAVEKTFTKAATVTVKVTISLPGGKTKVITSTNCKKEVGVVQEQFLYVCDALIATARDNTNRKFRFTAIHKKSDNVTLNSADFTLDGTVTTKGVTDKNQDGYIFKDYDFNDAVTHTVSVVINFTADGKKVTSKESCVAKVTPEKPPVCIHNPNLPPEHPDCKKPECVEKPGSGFPPGDERCKELPKTGAGSVAGLFVGISAAGAAAHRLFTNYRARRNS